MAVACRNTPVVTDPSLQRRIVELARSKGRLPPLKAPMVGAPPNAAGPSGSHLQPPTPQQRPMQIGQQQPSGPPGQIPPRPKRSSTSPGEEVRACSTASIVVLTSISSSTRSCRETSLLHLPTRSSARLRAVLMLTDSYPSNLVLLDNRHSPCNRPWHP